MNFLFITHLFSLCSILTFCIFFDFLNTKITIISFKVVIYKANDLFYYEFYFLGKNLNI